MIDIMNKNTAIKVCCQEIILGDTGAILNNFFQCSILRSKEGFDGSPYGPAGQRLGHPGHKEEVLGTGQKVKSPLLAASVDSFFNVRQKVRSVLDFLQDHRRGVQLENPPGGLPQPRLGRPGTQARRNRASRRRGA